GCLAQLRQRPLAVAALRGRQPIVAHGIEQQYARIAGSEPQRLVHLPVRAMYREQRAAAAELRRREAARGLQRQRLGKITLLGERAVEARDAAAGELRPGIRRARQ